MTLEVRTIWEVGDERRKRLRTCPFCKETIREGAIKCKHCGSELALKR
jgi:ribosomal protein L37AE/L43A